MSFAVHAASLSPLHPALLSSISTLIHRERSSQFRNRIKLSAPVQHEIQAEYALQCALKISTENLHSLAPAQTPTNAYLEHVETWHRTKSVWAESCKSWVKYNGRVALWCGSMVHMLKTLRTPRWEDYEFKRRDANMWTFLGDGRTEREVMKVSPGGEDIDLAPWMRNGDVGWSIEM